MNVIHLFTFGSYGRSDGRFRSPKGIAVNSFGEIYVCDTGNNRVQKFAPDGTFISYLEPNYVFHRPLGIAINSNDEVFIIDHCYLWKFGKDDEYIFNLDTFEGTDCLSYDENDFAIATDSNNNVFVADRNYVLIYNSVGRKISSFGGSYLNSQFKIVPGQILNPYGIAINSKNQIFITSGTENCIYKFVPLVNSPRPRWTRVLWVGIGRNNSPTGIAINSRDDVFVCDTGNKRINVYNSNGRYIDSIYGDFDAPYGIAIDSFDRIFITDVENDNIQIFKIEY